MITFMTAPMANRLLVHVSNTPIEYCQDKGILVEAYSPIAHIVFFEKLPYKQKNKRSRFFQTS